MLSKYCLHPLPINRQTLRICKKTISYQCSSQPKPSTQHQRFMIVSDHIYTAVREQYSSIGNFAIFQICYIANDLLLNQMSQNVTIKHTDQHRTHSRCCLTDYIKHDQSLTPAHQQHAILALIKKSYDLLPNKAIQTVESSPIGLNKKPTQQQTCFLSNHDPTQILFNEIQTCFKSDQFLINDKSAISQPCLSTNLHEFSTEFIDILNKINDPLYSSCLLALTNHYSFAIGFFKNRNQAHQFIQNIHQKITRPIIARQCPQKPIPYLQFNDHALTVHCSSEHS